MANETERYRGRTMPGPVTLAACLLDLVETLYARTVALQEQLAVASTSEDQAEYWRNNAQETIAEWEEFRNEWKPHLERVIAKPRR